MNRKIYTAAVILALFSLSFTWFGASTDKSKDQSKNQSQNQNSNQSSADPKLTGSESDEKKSDSMQKIEAKTDDSKGSTNALKGEPNANSPSVDATVRKTDVLPATQPSGQPPSNPVWDWFNQKMKPSHSPQGQKDSQEKKGKGDKPVEWKSQEAVVSGETKAKKIPKVYSPVKVYETSKVYATASGAPSVYPVIQPPIKPPVKTMKTIQEPVQEPSVLKIQNQISEIIQINDSLTAAHKANIGEIQKIVEQARIHQRILDELERGPVTKVTEEEAKAAGAEAALRKEKLKVLGKEVEKNQKALQELEGKQNSQQNNSSGKKAKKS